MTTLRKICYMTGTRADFGLMESTLRKIHAASNLELSLIVTGTHLSQSYGFTILDIEGSSLPIDSVIELNYNEVPSGASMAVNIGFLLQALVNAFNEIKPDLVLLLGDRGEMLAAALAAIHLNIPIAHVHGGERSGTVDEPIRHAISKLSHLHFVATQASRERLIKMGEREDCIWVTGAPGLDGLRDIELSSKETLVNQAGFTIEKKIALLVYHPVVQDTETLASDTEVMLEVLQEFECQVVALLPNSDSGSESIKYILENKMDEKWIYITKHLTRNSFISWMAVSDLMMGNSSSGIIEAATFGTPVINIGNRQNLRERNSNVIDVNPNLNELKSALKFALSHGKFPLKNIYGDGRAAERIVSILSGHSLSKELLFKSNVY